MFTFLSFSHQKCTILKITQHLQLRLYTGLARLLKGTVFQLCLWCAGTPLTVETATKTQIVRRAREQEGTKQSKIKSSPLIWKISKQSCKLWCRRSECHTLFPLFMFYARELKSLLSVCRRATVISGCGCSFARAALRHGERLRIHRSIMDDTQKQGTSLPTAAPHRLP